MLPESLGELEGLRLHCPWNVKASRNLKKKQKQKNKAVFDLSLLTCFHVFFLFTNLSKSFTERVSSQVAAVFLLKSAYVLVLTDTVQCCRNRALRKRYMKRVRAFGQNSLSTCHIGNSGT